MQTRVFVLIVSLFISFVIGCAGTGNSPNRPSKYKKTLGNCLRNEFTETINKILFVKHAYLDAGNARDLGAQIELYTEWKARSPFPEEKVLGIVAVESRITVGAKSSSTTRSFSTSAANFKAYFQAENRVKYLHAGEWEPGPMTKDAKRYFGDIATDISQEFTTPF